MLDGAYVATTDVWSAGVICCFLLTGKNPFRGPSKAATEHRVKMGSCRLDSVWSWDGASDAARSLTRLLLSPASERPSAKQALRHEWIKQRQNSSAFSLSQAIPGLMERQCELSGWTDKQADVSDMSEHSRAHDSESSAASSANARSPSRLLSSAQVVRANSPVDKAEHDLDHQGEKELTVQTPHEVAVPSAQLVWLQKMETKASHAIDLGPKPDGAECESDLAHRERRNVLSAILGTGEEEAISVLKRKGNRKRVAKWQPRRMWMDTQNNALCYVHLAPSRLTAAVSIKYGKAMRTAGGSLSVGGSEVSTQQCDSVGRDDTANDLHDDDTTSSVGLVPVAGAHGAQKGAFSVAHPVRRKSIPLRHILSVRLLGGKGLVLELQCNQRVYSFKFTQLSSTTCSQLATLLGQPSAAMVQQVPANPTPLQDNVTLPTHGSAPAAAVDAAAAARTQVAAASAAAEEVARVFKSAPSHATKSSEVLKCEAATAVAAALNAAEAARSLVERASARVQEAARMTDPEPGHESADVSPELACVPARRASKVFAPPTLPGMMPPPHSPTLIMLPLPPAPAARAASNGRPVRKTRPFWELKEERKERDDSAANGVERDTSTLSNRRLEPTPARESVDRMLSKATTSADAREESPTPAPLKAPTTGASPFAEGEARIGRSLSRVQRLRLQFLAEARACAAAAPPPLPPRRDAPDSTPQQSARSANALTDGMGVTSLSPSTASALIAARLSSTVVDEEFLVATPAANPDNTPTPRTHLLHTLPDLSFQNPYRTSSSSSKQVLIDWTAGRGDSCESRSVRDMASFLDNMNISASSL